MMTSRNSYSRLWVLMGLLVLVLSSMFSDQTPTLTRNLPQEAFLSNGLKLIYQKDASSSITVLQILIRGGKGTDPEGKDGLAYLTARLALEIPDRSKIQDLMSQASRTSIMSFGDFSIINISCLSEHLEETLKITSKIMLKPLFSGLRIKAVKNQMTYRKNRQEDDSINVGHNALLEKFFANTSYAGSVLGSEESLKAIKKKDIKNYYDQYFIAENMAIVVISDQEKRYLTQILEEYLGKFPSGECPKSKSNSSTSPEEKEIFIDKDSKQFFISLAFPLPNITSKNFILAYLMENFLGTGVGSRLWSLRYKEKLAYNVNARATQMKDGGILEAYLETDVEKKEVALEALKKELSVLFEKGITEEELKVAKTYTRASFLRNNETKEKRARSLASYEALGLGYEFINGFILGIDEVGLEEMNTYLKDILDPEKAVEVVIGPKD